MTNSTSTAQPIGAGGYIQKLIAQERAQVLPQVGELASGKFYAFPVGGQYVESTSREDIIDHLILNT